MELSIPEKYKTIIESFFLSYQKALQTSGQSILDYIPLFTTFLELIKQQMQKPYTFQHFHTALRTPIDYYRFGIEFFRPLVDLKNSSVHGWEHFVEIDHHLERGHNVILFANHQIEADPQAISLLIERSHQQLAEEMIFVAGERVLSDPLAVPLSLGRNLLCIYSKKYMANIPPEDREKRHVHNKKTMSIMGKLLYQGKKCIYVAPSGGRDRPNAKGRLEVAPFDERNIEMFYLMASKAKAPTHFYPLALATYTILPPPADMQIELGEVRSTEWGSIHLGLGKEIDMEQFQGKEAMKERRDFIYHEVQDLYQQITQ